jgi:hypothetical protein
MAAALNQTTFRSGTRYTSFSGPIVMNIGRKRNLIGKSSLRLKGQQVESDEGKPESHIDPAI